MSEDKYVEDNGNCRLFFFSIIIFNTILLSLSPENVDYIARFII